MVVQETVYVPVNEAVAPVAEQLPQVPVGATLELAGQALGKETGKVLVAIGPLTLPATVKQWNETVVVTLPSFGLVKPTVAEILIVRSNGELDTAIAVELVPAAPNALQEEVNAIQE